jgi:hypothetical protein
MAAFLLIAGIASLLAGVLAMALGIPVKEFSFGNTLILVGAVGICTGFILLGLWTVVRELRSISRGLAGGASVKSRVPSRPGAAALRLEPGGDPSFSREQNQEPSLQQYAAGSEPAAQPWHDEPVSPTADDTSEPLPGPPSVKPRRNLLFSSTSRRERERGQARAEPSAASPLDFPASFSAPNAEAGEASPGTGENPWPSSRSGNVPSHRRGNRPQSSFTDPGAGGSAADQQATNEDRPAVTVLKSGTVDGMAYSLYSDGSIEAQMPEGMMRFGSINELRAHLEHRP